MGVGIVLMRKGEPMSVLIKDMEKPKSCFEIIDGDFEYCPFVNTDDDCVLLLKKAYAMRHGECSTVSVRL